jgi:hypothetical protein
LWDNRIHAGFIYSKQKVIENDIERYEIANWINVYTAMITFGSSENSLTLGYKMEDFKIMENTNVLYINGIAKVSNNLTAVFEQIHSKDLLDIISLGFKKNKKTYSYSYGVTYFFNFYDLNLSKNALPYLEFKIPIW